MRNNGARESANLKKRKTITVRAGTCLLILYAALLCPVIWSLAGCKLLDEARDEIEDQANPPGELPGAVSFEAVFSVDKRDLSVSGMRVLDNEDLLIFSYDRKTRDNTYVYRIPKSGSPFIELEADAETWNAVVDDLPNDKRIGDWSYIVAEDKGGKLRRVNVKAGKIETMDWRQPHEYSATTTDGYACYIPRGSGKYNELWNLHTRENTGIRFDKLIGIVTGLIKHDGKWVASVPDKGIQREDGAWIPAPCYLLATVGNRAIAFLTNGDVYKLVNDGSDFRLGDKIGSTGFKPTDYATDGQYVYWTTQHKAQYWVTNGDDMKMLADFGGEAKPGDSYGSLFWSTCGLDLTHHYVAVTKQSGGFKLYRGPRVALPPVTNEPPVIDPPVTNEPPVIDPPVVPERTGNPSYTGNGRFNTFLDLGMNDANPRDSFTFSCWFKVDNWSGGNREQSLGATLVCKGLVGSHWSFYIGVHPDGFRYGATRDSVHAPATIERGRWYHVSVTATGTDANFWLDGKPLADRGRDTGIGSLFQDGNQPVRIGGYYVPWPNASWFNQSIDGQITDWKLEVK